MIGGKRFAPVLEDMMSNESEAVTFARGAPDKRVARPKKVPEQFNLSARLSILLLSPPHKDRWKLGHSVAITGEKPKKWCVLVHFGASLLIGPRLRRALASEPQATHARLSARRRAGFPRLDASKKIEKVMQNDAK